jgi:hypothetical protein
MNVFRWSTVTKAWHYSKPYVIRMIGQMAADYGRPAGRGAR